MCRFILLIFIFGTQTFTVSADPMDLQNPPNFHNLSDPNHWYPSECCSMQDCYPLMDGDVIESNGGFKIQSTGEWFPYSKIRGSQDAQFHRCSSAGNRSNPTLIKQNRACLFVPGPGT